MNTDIDPKIPISNKRDNSQTARESNKENPQFGLKFFSYLNGLENFQIVRDMPYDPMHCLLEGVGKKIFNLLLLDLVQTNRSSV